MDNRVLHLGGIHIVSGRLRYGKNMSLGFRNCLPARWSSVAGERVKTQNVADWSGVRVPPV
jgi:hypothetical protein